MQAKQWILFVGQENHRFYRLRFDSDLQCWVETQLEGFCLYQARLYLHTCVCAISKLQPLAYERERAIVLCIFCVDTETEAQLTRAGMSETTVGDVVNIKN